MKLAQEGQVIEKPEDILKEPFVFEFTGLPQLPIYDEGDLEEALINNLSMFFLELGKGFTYVGNQQKITIGVGSNTMCLQTITKGRKWILL